MIARLGLIGFVLLVLGACSTGAPVPEDRFYQLDPGMPAVSPKVILKGGLSIAHIGADPLRGGRAILYRNQNRPLELARYHYEFWAEQPPRMIQRALQDALRQSGIIDRVEIEGQRPHFRYELKVDVRRFESLVGAGRSQADIELEVVLRTTRNDVPVWTKVYRKQNDAIPGDMHALANAMQQGLEQIFEQLAEDLKAAETNDN
ncbi:hypothetical protein MNBD_GAMMA15-2158 [hydrothermal vent metagenome]|uniref:ABC-type transport auxiliary lipoprotein component domain-containing protein n=1 Tax=hydrothermal vent metagenome TaxID=652676 RepID=A0A3B0Y4U0_9ZZZZ